MNKKGSYAIEQDHNVDSVVKSSIPSGTIISFGGVPMKLSDDTEIEFNKESLPLMTQEASRVIGVIESSQ